MSDPGERPPPSEVGDEEPAPLQPARPDAAQGGGRAAWAPRIPWVWVILVVGGIGGIFASYFVRQGQRQEALRQQMLELHEERLSEVSERYLGFRQRIERLVREAGEGGEPETYADPRLRISGLRAGEGLYLRIPADWTNTPERIEGAALAMEPDAITRCLGLAPMSARGLYERGYFLTPEWVSQVRDEPDMMALRVLDDQLGRHVQVDVPVVLSMVQAEWFMLVLQRGDTRREHPVDVFLWDLRRNTPLLRARIQGRGLLVPVRLRFDGVNPPPAPGRPSVNSTGATDCSIASQIRALAGEDPVDFESGGALLDAARRADEAEAAEGAADGEPATAREPAEEGAPAAPPEAPSPEASSPEAAPLPQP